jgi:hypothetical protein
MGLPVLHPVYLCLHAVTTTPAVTDGICPLVLFHRCQPSPTVGRVGSCICCFGACSVFTAHYGLQTRRVALSDPLHQRLRQLRCLRYRSDCFRVERTSSRAGLSTRGGPAPFTAHRRKVASSIASHLDYHFGLPSKKGWLDISYYDILSPRDNYDRE